MVYSGADLPGNAAAATGDTNLAAVIFDDGSVSGMWRGDRKEANLRALGLVRNAPEDTFLSPEDDEVDVPPFVKNFVKSQLFANFRNSLDEEGAAEWCNRLAAALKVDVDALATCRKALRRAPPSLATESPFASPTKANTRWSRRDKRPGR